MKKTVLQSVFSLQKFFDTRSAGMDLEANLLVVTVIRIGAAIRHALFQTSRMSPSSRTLKLLRQNLAEVIQILIGQQMAPTALGPEDNKLYNCFLFCILTFILLQSVRTVK